MSPHYVSGTKLRDRYFILILILQSRDLKPCILPRSTLVGNGLQKSILWSYKNRTGPEAKVLNSNPQTNIFWWDLKYALMQSKTDIKTLVSPSLISLGLVGVTHDAIANQRFEGKTINSLFMNNILLLTSGHCWIKSRKPWGPGAVQWLSRLDFQGPSVANISFRANILGRNTNCFPHPENSTRKGTEIKRGEREGGNYASSKYLSIWPVNSISTATIPI